MSRLILTSAAVGVMCFAAGIAYAAYQPHMEATLRALQTAKAEIVQSDANNDHGGHAGKATELINRAITEVELGIQYRNEHGQ
jgi:hypothetical protein